MSRNKNSYIEFILRYSARNISALMQTRPNQGLSVLAVDCSRSCWHSLTTKKVFMRLMEVDALRCIRLHRFNSAGFAANNKLGFTSKIRVFDRKKRGRKYGATV